MKTEKKTKVLDKWKTKQWYSVLAPSLFGNKEIAEIVSSDENNIKNRIISVTIKEIGEQLSHGAMFTSLKFRIDTVKAKNAYTKFIGHEIAPSYLRMLSRRNHSLINIVYDAKTKDEQKIRLKIIAITGSKVSQNTKKNIYEAIMEEMKKIGQEFTLDQLIQEILFGKLTKRIFNRLKQITFIKRVEVRKSELKESFD